MRILSIPPIERATLKPLQDLDGCNASLYAHGSSYRWRSDDEHGESTEVLGEGAKCELVLCTGRPSQPKPAKL
jgi:hypothetical protein